MQAAPSNPTLRQGPRGGWLRRHTPGLFAWLLAALPLAACTNSALPGQTVGALAAPQSAACSVRRIATLSIKVQRGFLLVPGSINGTPVSLLVDTGAEGAMVTPEAVARLELPRDEGHRTALVGVGGRVISVNALMQEFSVGSVELGPRSISVGPLPSFPEVQPPVSGILGADFLSRFDVVFDVPTLRMLLYDVRNCHGDFMDLPVGAFILPLRRSRANRMLLDVRIDGQPTTAMLDTGARLSVMNTALAARLGVTPATLLADVGGTGRGIDQNTLIYHRHHFPTVQIGPETLLNDTIDVADVSLPDESMLLGADYLQTHRIWLSFSTAQMFVLPVAH
jgi:predicted aspartyl protease